MTVEKVADEMMSAGLNVTMAFEGDDLVDGMISLGGKHSSKHIQVGECGDLIVVEKLSDGKYKFGAIRQSVSEILEDLG